MFDSMSSDVLPVSAKITGTLPPYLRGTLLRNGPARYEVGPTAYRHWFDGQGMLHSFHIDAGKVTYSARFLQSNQYKENVDADRIRVAEFGTPLLPDPCQNIFRRFFSFFKPSRISSANVNVAPVNDKWLAFGEVPILWQFDPSTLETVKGHNYARSSGTSLILNTAHPHAAGNGEIYNFGVSAGLRPKYNLLRSRLVPPDNPDKETKDIPDEDVTLQSEVLCSIPSTSTMSYYHSFAMTENYAILPEMPLKYSLFSAGTMHLRQKSFEDCLYWKPDTPTRLHVIDLRTNKELTATYTTVPFFAFHHVNAYEDPENNRIIMDAVCYPDNEIIKKFYLVHLRSQDTTNTEVSFPGSHFRRFFIPLEDGNTRKAIDVPYDDLTDQGGELPGINRKYKRRKYRYAYGIDISAFHGLIKLDVDTKEVKKWEPGEGLYISEPVFVPSPEEKSEDDGVVLSAVISADRENKPSFLAVLDAASFTLLAKAEVPCQMATTFHGRFMADL